jgi:hypothetical protein
VAYGGYWVGKTVTQAKTFSKSINLASQLSKTAGGGGIKGLLGSLKAAERWSDK